MQDDTWENEINVHDYGSTTEEDFLQMLYEIQEFLEYDTDRFCDLLSEFKLNHRSAMRNYFSVKQKFNQLSRYC